MAKKKSGVPPKKRTAMDRKARRRSWRQSMSATFPTAKNIAGKPITQTKRKKAAKASYRNRFFI